MGFNQMKSDRRFPRLRALRKIVMLSVFVLTTVIAGANSYSLERYLPPKANSVWLLRDFGMTKNQLQRLPFLSDERGNHFEEFVDYGTDNIKNQLRFLEKLTSTSFEDIFQILHPDKAALGAYNINKQNSESSPQFFLLVKINGDPEKVAVFAEDIVKNASSSADWEFDQDSLYENSVYRIRGAEDTVNAGVNFCFTFNENLLAVSFGKCKSIIMSHLAILNDESAVETLYNTEVYASLIQKSDKDADLLVFQHYDQLWDSLADKDRDNILFPPDSEFKPGEILDIAGLFSLQATLTTFRISHRGVLIDGFARIKEPGKGIWGALSPGQNIPDLTPPPFVDADAEIFAAAYCDLNLFWALAETILGKFLARGNSEVGESEPHVHNGGSGSEFSEQLLAKLESQIMLYIPSPKAQEDRGTVLSDTVLALGLKDRQGLENLLIPLLRNISGGTMRTLDMNGYKCILLPLPHTQDKTEPGNSSMPLVAVGFLDDFLLITGNIALMREVIGKSVRNTSPLLTSRRLQSALIRHFKTPSHFAYGSIDIIESLVLKPLYHKFMQDVHNRLSYNKLKLSKLFTDISFSTRWDSNGLRYRCWMSFE